MPANPVVETFDKLEDGLPGLASCLEGSAFDTFSFQGPTKRFGDCMIVTGASTTHTSHNTGIREQALIGITGLVRSPIRMKHDSLGGSPSQQRHLESLLTERFVPLVAAIAHPITRREERSRTPAR